MKPRKVTIEIDAGIYEALNAIGVMRDIHPETIVHIQLLAYVRSFEKLQVLGPDDRMPYGQYKDHLIRNVIKVNPRYIAWLLTESTIFKLSEEAIELLNYLKGDEEDPFTYDEVKSKDINDA